MKLLLPLILLILGTGGGVAAGLFLAPPEADLGEESSGENSAQETEVAAAAEESEATEGSNSTTEFARLNNQFVIPVVTDEVVAALVVVSLSVEVPAGGQTIIFEQEPKLRDAFLQVLFDHANLGGFDGQFTASANMRNLRTALRNAARDAVGRDVIDVLILEMVRQDV